MLKSAYYIKSLLFLPACFTSISAVAQHQVHFSQYFLHPSFINVAAMAGYTTFSAAAFHRNQWTGMPGAPRYSGIDVSNTLGYNQAAGLTVMEDRLGASAVLSLAANYAIRFKLNLRDNLAFGLSPTFLFLQKNMSLLRHENPNDPELTGSDMSVVAPNVRVGVYYYSKRYYFGISSPNLLYNDIGNEAGFVGTSYLRPNAIQLNVHAGHSFSMSNDWEFMPSLLYKQMADSRQFDLNAQVQYKKMFSFGMAYRSKETLSFMGNLAVGRDIRIAYSFDWSLGRLSNHNSGTHEFMLVYQLASIKKKAIISCPRF